VPTNETKGIESMEILDSIKNEVADLKTNVVDRFGQYQDQYLSAREDAFAKYDDLITEVRGNLTEVRGNLVKFIPFQKAVPVKGTKSKAKSATGTFKFTLTNSRRKVTIDLKDAKRCEQHGWKLHTYETKSKTGSKKKNHVYTTIKKADETSRRVSLAGFLLKLPPRTPVKHTNGDQFDFRRANLTYNKK
jgi:hypothetical protein